MENIEPKKLNELLHDENHDEILVDVREPFEYKSSAIPEAENIPAGKITDEVGRLKKYGTVYVNCGSGVRSREVCKLLEAQGVHVVNLSGGLTAWQESGLTVRGTGKSIPIIRQTMLAAGLFVLIGVCLMYLVSPYWVILPIFIGSGLAVSGVTGCCLMSYILERMPWNK